MREVVVTGIGIVSSIGNNVAEVANSLHSLKSGISHNDINAELGLRSHVSGSIKNLDCKELIDRRTSQIDNKIAQLRSNLRGQSTKEDFEKNIDDLEEIVEDLKSQLERTLTPLRNG